MLLVRTAPNLVTCAQIRPEDLRGVVKARFTTLINCRPDGEAPDQPTSAELEAEAKEVGLDYVHVPILTGHVTEAATRAFADAVAKSKGQALAFCSNGNRPISLWKATSLLR